MTGLDLDADDLQYKCLQLQTGAWLQKIPQLCLRMLVASESRSNSVCLALCLMQANILMTFPPAQSHNRDLALPQSKGIDVRAALPDPWPIILEVLGLYS